ncbi:unnamed protein product [Heligmosomoides polygyrus]|uniref:Cystatin domain-containing protein n=1 Tax=Heligmosomoides polygyrus TaxID=6339 RepID=A0A183FRE4_HELPZ|nr:unnamed protein product [Heligmosomoides polygyrus]
MRVRTAWVNGHLADAIGLKAAADNGTPPASVENSMAHLLILLSIVTTALACAPTEVPTTTTTATTPTTTATTTTTTQTPTPAGGRRKRGTNQVEVTIVSRQNFDPEMNPHYLKVVEARVEAYSKKIGLENNREVKGDVRNIGGKFAVVYILPDAACDKVIDFVKGAKENTDVIEHAAVKCQGREKVLL